MVGGWVASKWREVELCALCTFDKSPIVSPYVAIVVVFMKGEAMRRDVGAIGFAKWFLRWMAVPLLFILRGFGGGARTLKAPLLAIAIASISISGVAWSADYSCPGESVSGLDGAKNNASASYSEDTTSESARYFQFTTDVAGTVSITVDRKSKNQIVYIGTSCGGSQIDSNTGSDTYTNTFDVAAGTTYYIKIKENNGWFTSYLRFDINFSFVSRAADLEIAEENSPAPSPVNKGESVAFSVKAINHGPGLANKDIVVKFRYNMDVEIDSLNSAAGFACDTTSGTLSAGNYITCTKSSSWSDLGSVEHFTLNVKPSSGGTLTQTAQITSTATSDPDMSNNSIDSSVNVVNAHNNPPTDITIDNDSIDERNAIGDTIGTLSAVDADSSDTHTYRITGGDSSSFTIDGNELKAAEVFDYESKNSYRVQIEVDDGNGGTFEKELTININDIPEADISLGQYHTPSPNPAEEDKELTFYLRAIKDSSVNSLADIDLKVYFNMDVEIVSIDQVAGGSDFENCDHTSGSLAAGDKITCTKSTTLSSTDPNKDIEIKVKPKDSGTIRMIATLVPKTTPDPDNNNNTVSSSADVEKVCNGCDCGGDDPADNDAAPGVAISRLDGATSDVSKCIVGSVEKGGWGSSSDEDYYHFSTDVNGTLDIRGSSPNGKKYTLHIGTASDEDAYWEKSTENHDPQTIAVVAGEEIRIHVEPYTSDAQYKIEFDFVSSESNHAPYAYYQKLTTRANNPLDITLRGEDPDGDPINYTVLTQPKHGTLSGTAPNLRYTPDQDFIGSDIFTFKVDDGNLSSDETNISIRVADSTYTEGPDICYSFRKEEGFNFFGVGFLYKETTGVHANTDVDNVRIYKGIVRGFDIFSMMSGIGIGDTSKTTAAGDDEAEQRNFAQADFVNNDYTMLQILPGGTAYRLGEGAGSGENDGGTMHEGDDSSYYNSAFFKMGFFTQYAHVVTYEKNGVEYTEVLQPCDADEHGPLDEKPEVMACGLYMGALNSASKVTFDVDSGISQLIRNETRINTPVLDDPNAVALCKGNVACVADGIGSTPATLPDFIYSQETQSNIITQGAVIGGKQHIGPITISHDDNTSSDERTFVFEAPYSDSYKGKVMLIKSITDNDSTSDKHTYVFREGDYWIESWNISGNKDVTIKTSGRVRFFIKDPFKIEIEGALNIGQDSADTASQDDPKFYMFAYDDVTLDVTGATASYLGYIYSKGDVYLGSTTTFVIKYGAVTADGELKLKTGAPGDYLSYKDENDTQTGGYFKACEELTVSWQFDEYHIAEDTQTPMPYTKTVVPKPTIVLSRKVPFDVNVSYRTYDGSAEKGSDYVETKKTVTIPAGENNVSVDIEIYNDPPIEPEEDFFVELYNPVADGNVSLNDKNTTRIVIDEQTDAPICFEDSFDGGLDNKWRVIKSKGGFTPHVIEKSLSDGSKDYRLRFTDNTYQVSTAITKDYMFDTKENLIILEFDYYAYGGCGRNHEGTGNYGGVGIVNVLFDSAVGDTPKTGSFSGSIGYAQIAPNEDGFEGGWLGLGLDEYGDFANCDKGRKGGLQNTSCDNGNPFEAQDHANTASIRGDGSGVNGYEFLQGVDFGALGQPSIAKKDSNDYGSGKYRLIVDGKHEGHLYIRLDRDTGSGYQTVIDKFDAMDSKYKQETLPDFVRYAITARNSDGCNFHEMSWIRMKGNCRAYIVGNNYATGPFAVVDTFRWNDSSLPHSLKDGDPHQRVISTKIVNKPFRLVIASMKANGIESEIKPGIKVKYGLFSGDSGQAYMLDSLREADFGANADMISDEFNIKRAVSRAHARVFYCGDFNGTGTLIHPLNECWDDSKSDKENMLAAVEENKKRGLHLFYHISDLFAVRPSDFNVSVDNTTLPTGEDVNIHFGAEQNGGGASIGFNEKAGTTFDVNVSEKKNGCIVGSFSPVDISKGWSFDDGVADSNSSDAIKAVVTRYMEAGVVDIVISDENLSCEKRFASIDCNDLNVSGYWNSDTDTVIGTASVQNVRFEAQYFDINETTVRDAHSASDVNFTYISRDLNESVSIKMKISAVANLQNDSVINNYNSDCYAKDITLSLRYLIDGGVPGAGKPENLSKILYLLRDDSSPVTVVSGERAIDSNALSVKIGKSIFNTEHNGTANIEVKLNFDRNITKSCNPFYMNIAESNVSDGVATGGASSDYNATYLYARVKSSKELYDNIEDSSVKTPISIVVYYLPGGSVTLDKNVFMATNEYDWYLNTAHKPEDGNISLQTWDKAGASVTPTPSVSGGYDPNVSVNALASDRPLVVSVDMNGTDSWLIYNKNGKDSNPSPLYRVRFIGSGGWFGVGETGSVIENDANIRKNNRLEW
jgi:hypothetical protein